MRCVNENRYIRHIFLKASRGFTLKPHSGLQRLQTPNRAVVPRIKFAEEYDCSIYSSDCNLDVIFSRPNHDVGHISRWSIE